MKILELFAGSRSISKVAHEMGWETFTSDYRAFDKIDYVCDIMDFDIKRIPFTPDFIWASPPCTYFSVASIGHHWNKDHTPKTKEAVWGVKIIEKTIEIIKTINPKYFFIENPRGKLRKLNLFCDIADMTTVCYCKYADTRMKPTDIWTNHLKGLSCPNGWQPRPMCFNGNVNCHHAPAPRGSKTGTQGLKGDYLRSVIPDQLCREILTSTIN